jgi:hypothetical protein
MGVLVDFLLSALSSAAFSELGLAPVCSRTPSLLEAHRDVPAGGSRAAPTFVGLDRRAGSRCWQAVLAVGSGIGSSRLTTKDNHECR